MGPVDPLDRGARMDRGRGRKERHTTMKRITLIGAVLALAAVHVPLHVPLASSL